MIIPVAKELNSLFRPYIDMYLFHILDAYVMGREASRRFMLVAAVLFLLSLFFGPENRSGFRLYARIAFLLIIGALVYTDRLENGEDPSTD